MQGVDLDKETGQHTTTSSSGTSQKPIVPLFGDPEEYNNLSPEEKQKKTDEMLAVHRGWANGKPLGGGKTKP